MKFKHILAAVLLIVLTIQPITALASNTTLTFAQNRRGWLVRTQDAYLPDRNITTLGMSNPQNMVFGPDGLLYIADTGNRRILVFDVHTEEVVQELRYEGFSSPRGVFVTPNNILYVADAGAGAVFLFNESGEHIRTHTEPTAMAFGDTRFAPNRIAVDVRGNMYIVGEGVFGGIIQLSAEGEFLGFFASNRTTITFTQMLQDFFFTDRQQEGVMDRIPITFSNVTVDDRGVVYTTAMGSITSLQSEAVKRHDMAGRNTFPSNLIYSLSFADLAVDSFGNVFAASVSGDIYVYNNRGEFIFVFGSGFAARNEDIAGWFRNLISIAVSPEGHIWALDSERAFLQSFTPTEYTLMIYHAQSLFNAGLYEESAELWAGVLRHNQMSILAHAGLGRSQLYQQNFADAQVSFMLAGNRFYYSEAFWEVRNTWLLNNLAIILIAVATFFALMSVFRHFDRQRIVATKVSNTKATVMNAPYLKPVLFAFTVARHPLDSYYYMKIREKGSLGGAIFHFLLFFAAYMVFQTSRGFIVQFAEIVDMDFIVIIGGFFGLFALFILSNYLVTSIKDGEGGILDIFKLVSYGLFPLTITLFGVTLLSHVLTLNEVFLLDFAMLFGFVYTISIIWLGFQEIHNYNFATTLKSLLITAFFMVVVLVVVFNLVILFNELVNFFESIGMEVYVNVMGLY